METSRLRDYYKFTKDDGSTASAKLRFLRDDLKFVLDSFIKLKEESVKVPQKPAKTK